VSKDSQLVIHKEVVVNYVPDMKVAYIKWPHNIKLVYSCSNAYLCAFILEVLNHQTNKIRTQFVRKLLNTV